MKTKEQILVTGGAGFIGSHVVEILIKNDYYLEVIDDLSAGIKENVPQNVKLKIKQVIQINKEDIKHFDIIVHCAAQVSTFYSIDYPEEDFKRNAQATFHLFETCRKYNDNALIIYTSSRSVHGNISEPLIAKENFPFKPHTFYNLHKIYGEMLCKIYKELYGMKFIILRPSNVYGPKQPYWMKGWYNFIAYWIKLALEGKPIPIYGTGKQIRDYTYVEDVANAYLLSIKKRNKAIGETFLLTSGKGVSLNELADLIIKLTKSTSEKRYLPPRKGDIMRFVGSYEKAKKILNWEPKVNLEEGLKKEIDWIKNRVSYF